MEALTKLQTMMQSQQAIYDEWSESSLGNACFGLGKILNDVLIDSDMKDTQLAGRAWHYMAQIEANTMHEDLAKNYFHQITDPEGPYAKLMGVKFVSDETMRGHKWNCHVAQIIQQPATEQTIVQATLGFLQDNATSPTSIVYGLDGLFEILNILWAKISQDMLDGQGRIDHISPYFKNYRTALMVFVNSDDENEKAKAVQECTMWSDYISQALSANSLINDKDDFLSLEDAKDIVTLCASIEITDNPHNHSLWDVQAANALVKATVGDT